MLDSMPTILVNEFGESRNPNLKMRALIASGLITLRSSQKLQFFRAGDDIEFARLLTQAFVRTSHNKRLLMNVQLRDHPGPNVLEISRFTERSLSDDQATKPNATEHEALVTIRCRHLQRLPSPSEIQDALGVSPMEAVAVHGLVHGFTAEEQASLRNASAETVRWHIKNVYVRLLCAGRAELVQLVLGLTGTTFDEVGHQ